MCRQYPVGVLYEILRLVVNYYIEVFVWWSEGYFSIFVGLSEKDGYSVGYIEKTRHFNS